MYYLNEEPKRSPLRWILIIALLLTGGYFALAKWSPRTLERARVWLTTDKAAKGSAPVLPIEPAPQATEAKPEPPRQPNAPATGITAPTSEAPATVDKTAQVAVLLYHRVEANASPALRIAPELFEEHMQKLKDANITVISMQDFLAWKRGEKSIPARSALITIDDGFSSTFDVARPILKKYGYPWTCFVYTNFISRGSALTWEQLAQLRDEGVEIGCHSHSHANLRDTQGKPPEVYEEWLKQEIAGAKQTLEQRLGIRCATYAYPFGSYSNRVLEHVKAAGFEAAFTLGSIRTSFSAPSDRIARFSWLDARPHDFNPVFSWSGRVQAADAPQANAAVATPSAPAETAIPILTQPLDGDVIADPQPLLRADLAALGNVDANTVSLRLSGVGMIPFSWVPDSKLTISAKVPKPLEPGDYTVTVTALAERRRVEAQWRFRVESGGGYDNALRPSDKPR